MLTKDMLGSALAEAAGPLKDFAGKLGLGGEEGPKWLEEFKKFLRKEKTWGLLTLLRTVRISAQPATTTSEGYFKEAGVGWMGGNFKAQFLGLEVPATNEVELAVRKLEEASLDAPILNELGDKAEISVSQFREFLSQNRSSSGWFIFHLNLKGKDGKPWAVDAGWSVDYRGWGVGAFSATFPFRWCRGDQVVSQV